MPGSAVAPSSSTTRVFGPILASISASLPTATILPSRAASAWAFGRQPLAPRGASAAGVPSSSGSGHDSV